MSCPSSSWIAARKSPPGPLSTNGILIEFLASFPVRETVVDPPEPTPRIRWMVEAIRHKMLWVLFIAQGISTTHLNGLEDFIGQSGWVTLGEQNPTFKGLCWDCF